MNQLTAGDMGAVPYSTPQLLFLTFLFTLCSPELSPDFSVLFLEMLLQTKEVEPEQLPPGTEIPLPWGLRHWHLWVWTLCPHGWVAQGVLIAQLYLEAGSRCSAAGDVPGAAPGKAKGPSSQCSGGDSALQGIASGELGFGLTLFHPSSSHSPASQTAKAKAQCSQPGQREQRALAGRRVVLGGHF